MSKSKDKPIQLRNLGKSKLKITPIGQGVMQFAGGTTFMRFLYPVMDDKTSSKIVKTAWDNGINWFDTAESYGSGISESKLAQGLKKAKIKDDEVIIATKWSPIFRRYTSIKKTIAERMKFLDPYSIDLHQIHNQMSFSSVEKQLHAMADLYDERKIKTIGVSNFSAKNMIKAHEVLEERGLPLVSNQVNYSLVHRRIESNGILEAAKELSITIIAWSPLQMGVLTGYYHNNPDAMKEKLIGRRFYLRRYIEKSRDLNEEMKVLAEKYKTSIAQIALNWLVNYHGKIVVAIPGATKVKQVKKNGEAMKIKLSKKEMEKLDEKSQSFL